MPRGETEAQRFANKVDKTGTCWLWRGATVGHMGYGHFWFRGRLHLAHRASWVMHRGPIPPGAMVLHHCDTPPCVNPDHLYVGDARANQRDKTERGRNAALGGERNGRALITSRDVPVIKALCASGLTQAEVGKRFGISRQAVSRIVLNQTWVSKERAA